MRVVLCEVRSSVALYRCACLLCAPPTPRCRVDMRKSACKPTTWPSYAYHLAMKQFSCVGNDSMHPRPADAVLIGGERPGTGWKPTKAQSNEEQTHTSLLPRPNPLITLPSSLSGNGFSGPLSGPAVGSRGPSGLMVVGQRDYLFLLIVDRSQ
jgi:hypothetical protein